MFFCLSLVWLRSSVVELDFCITPRRSIPPPEKHIRRVWWYMVKPLVKLMQSQTTHQPHVPFVSSHSISPVTSAMLCCSSKCPRPKQGIEPQNEGPVPRPAAVSTRYRTSEPGPCTPSSGGQHEVQWCCSLWTSFCWSLGRRRPAWWSEPHRLTPLWVTALGFTWLAFNLRCSGGELIISTHVLV